MTLTDDEVERIAAAVVRRLQPQHFAPQPTIPSVMPYGPTYFGPYVTCTSVASGPPMTSYNTST